MIETFKLTHGLYDNIVRNKLLTFKTESKTRGHIYKLTKKSTNTSKFAHFFTNRIVNIWNSLPDLVVYSENTNSFKNRLDKHWQYMLYNTDIDL